MQDQLCTVVAPSLHQIVAEVAARITTQGGYANAEVDVVDGQLSHTVQVVIDVLAESRLQLKWGA